MKLLPILMIILLFSGCSQIDSNNQQVNNNIFENQEISDQEIPDIDEQFDTKSLENLEEDLEYIKNIE